MLGCKPPPFPHPIPPTPYTQFKGLSHLENYYSVPWFSHIDIQVSPGVLWEMTNEQFVSSDVYTQGIDPLQTLLVQFPFTSTSSTTEVRKTT